MQQSSKNMKDEPWLSELAPFDNDDINLRMLGWQDAIKEEVLELYEANHAAKTRTK